MKQKITQCPYTGLKIGDTVANPETTAASPNALGKITGFDEFRRNQTDRNRKC